MWQALRERVGPGIRTVGPFFVLATAVGLGAAELDFPEGWLWDESTDGLVLSTIGAVAGSTLYGAFKLFDDRATAREAAAIREAENIERLCRKVFVPI